MKFTGKAAIITGGAGSIGRAIATQLAQEGAQVAIVDIDLEKAEEVASQIRATGGAANAYSLDLRDRNSIHQMAQAVKNDFGRIDILVNSAGGSSRRESQLLHKVDPEVLDRAIDVNLKGPLFCIREVLDTMINQGFGRIINIASIVALQGKKNHVDYSAAKGGVIAFSKSLAIEVGEHGITVNCVSPGLVPRQAQPEEFGRRYSYVNRICQPQDISSLVCFLCSDEAVYITGQNYVVDGGRSLGLKGD